MDETTQNKTDIGKLMELYRDAVSCDKDVFAGMKGNVLAVSGKHYTNIQKGLTNRMQKAGVDQKKRMRLSENHTAKAIIDRKDIILSMVGDVLAEPKSMKEMRAQKIAEIANKVIADGKEKNNWNDLLPSLVDSFEVTGELVAKVFYHPMKGGIKGWEQESRPYKGDHPLFHDSEGNLTNEAFSVGVDELGMETQSPNQMATPGEEFPVFLTDDNEPTFINTGKVKEDKRRPIWRGQMVIESFFPADLLRAKSAKCVKTSPYLHLRKMTPIEELTNLVKMSPLLDDEEKAKKIKAIEAAKGSTYKVFNGTTGEFQDAQDCALLIETYFRQSAKYPEGWFVIHTQDTILFEGPLPEGAAGEIAFPIKWEGNLRYATSARGFSFIRLITPNQVEVNRCASAQAETQITTGYDKVVTTGGGKLSKGVDQPGLRHFTTDVSKDMIQVIPGRSGDQFTATLERNIATIYRICQVEVNDAASTQAFDPKTEFYRTQKQKVKFTLTQQKVQNAIKAIFETYVFLTSKYSDLEDLSEMIGKEDAFAFGEEFLNSGNTSFQIVLKEVSDLLTMMGKSAEIEMVLQYVGKDIPPNQLIQLLSQLPILNREQAFKASLQDAENIQSDILSIERGKYVPADADDKHEMYIDALTTRMKQKDFEHLDSQIQEMFKAKREEHKKFKSEIEAQKLAASRDLIPMTGELVGVDLYESQVKPNGDGTKVVRMKMYSDALKWLKEQSEKQGTTVEMVEGLSAEAQQAQLAEMIQNQMNQAPQRPQPQFMPAI